MKDINEYKNKSILEYLEKNLTDNKLPRGFGLPAELKDDQLPFADGAKDGMEIYHMGSLGLSEKEELILDELMHAVSEGNFDVGRKKLWELSQRISAYGAIDDFENYIIENSDRLNIPNLCRFALMCISGPNVEFVKYGLEILELMAEPEEELKKDIRILGYCNEFTVFVIFNMLNWSNPNDEIFQLAQRVYGWGRIHAIRYLEATNEEIRKWLLKEGLDNDVLPAYSAFDVYEKADVRTLLKSEMTREELGFVTTILKALLDEEPVFGISAVLDAEEMFQDYCAQAKRFEPNKEILEVIEQMKSRLLS